MALIGKNKLGFVDGTIPMPAIDDPLYRLWERNNNMVASWLFNSISKELTASVIYSTTAVEIWTDLEERFQQQNGPRVFQLRRQLLGLTHGTQSVSQYYTKVKAIWEELGEYRPTINCQCGGLQPFSDYLQKEYVMSFLMGLNESFSQIRGQILLQDPIPSINKVFSLIVQEEKQREIGSSSSMGTDQSAAFAVQNSSQSSYGRSGAQGNYDNKGKADPRGNKNRPLCSHCGLLGHMKDKCYKLIGYPPHYNKNQARSYPSAHQVSDVSHGDSQTIGELSTSLTQQQYQQLLTMLQSQMNLAAASASKKPSPANSVGL